MSTILYIHRDIHIGAHTHTQPYLETALMIIHSDAFLKETTDAKSQKFFIGLSKSCWVVSKKLKLSPSKNYVKKL